MSTSSVMFHQSPHHLHLKLQLTHPSSELSVSQLAKHGTHQSTRWQALDVAKIRVEESGHCVGPSTARVLDTIDGPTLNRFAKSSWTVLYGWLGQ
jgi:hypothetical protein